MPDQDTTSPRLKIRMKPSVRDRSSTGWNHVLSCTLRFTLALSRVGLSRSHWLGGWRVVGDKLSGDAPRPKEPQVHSTLVEAEHDGSMGRSARGVDSANGTHSPGDQSPQDAVANESQHWPHRLWKFFTSTPSRKVFSGLGAVLTAVVAAIVAPIVAGWFSAGHSASITATQQIFYQPWTSSGLSRNIHVTSIHPGSCQSQSSFSSSTDAFRCIEGNFIEDPCFASPYVNNGIDPGAKNQVACPSLESYNPNSAIIIHLTQPLPFINDTRSANYLRPWLIGCQWRILC